MFGQELDRVSLSQPIITMPNDYDAGSKWLINVYQDSKTPLIVSRAGCHSRGLSQSHSPPEWLGPFSRDPPVPENARSWPFCVPQNERASFQEQPHVPPTWLSTSTPSSCTPIVDSVWGAAEEWVAWVGSSLIGPLRWFSIESFTAILLLEACSKPPVRIVETAWLLERAGAVSPDKENRWARELRSTQNCNRQT